MILEKTELQLAAINKKGAKCVVLTACAPKYLLWICDIAEIIRAFSLIDWEGLAEKAHHAHSRLMLDVDLLAAADLLESSMPGHVLQLIKSDSSGLKLVAQVK